MNAEKILFPTDFSNSANAALSLATSMARDTGATLLIVHVQEPPVTYEGVFAGIPVTDERLLERELTKVVPEDPAVDYAHRLIKGTPADAIVRAAEEENADMIVLGTHGRTGMARLLMGSVAEAVVRRAKCPVLTVKQPAADLIEEPKS